uniref:Protein CHROMATIN REMODELING 5 n=1 Tax=Rhizophora mucronata TaxID=61149 RepID=A0A2P2MF28_RHIMU
MASGFIQRLQKLPSSSALQKFATLKALNNSCACSSSASFSSTFSALSRISSISILNSLFLLSSSFLSSLKSSSAPNLKIADSSFLSK